MLSKNKFLAILILLSVVFVGFVATEVLVAETPVSFPDSNLEQAIRDAIDKPTGDIYESDLTTLTCLSADTRDILDLTGLEYCAALTDLDLDDNQIVNISPVSGLTNLTRLYLYGNQIVDISPVSGLTNLTRLDLYNNQITDISPVSGLTNLTRLSLSYNQIVDISPVSGLTNLTGLYLNNNQITDLQSLVDNTGIDTDDIIDVRQNLLDISSGSSDMDDITTLEGRGVTIHYDP